MDGNVALCPGVSSGTLSLGRMKLCAAVSACGAGGGTWDFVTGLLGDHFRPETHTAGQEPKQGTLLSLSFLCVKVRWGM